MNEKTLTAEQCSKLSLYILMTTKTREGEAATWEKLAEEKKEDGSPKYIHAADNVEPHSAKAHASDATRPLLLLHSQRARRSRPLHNDGRSLG